MKLWHISQPYGSSLCGQACVAMVLGIRLNMAIGLIGHDHGTKPKELAEALCLNGVHCMNYRVRYSVEKGLPPRALLAVSSTNRRRRYHWVLLWDDWIYDPANTCPCSLQSFLECFDGKSYRPGVTSYVALEDRRA